MGEPEWCEAGCEVGLVALAIASLLGGGLVEVPTVRFDDEPEVGPVEVGLVAVEASSCHRLGQAHAPDDPGECSLQLRLGEEQRLTIEELADCRGAGPPA